VSAHLGAKSLMNHLVCLIMIGVVGAAACGGTDGKQDISQAPFDLETEGKDDSPRFPSKGGDLRIAELETGSFTATRGFIGYEIRLEAGIVDIDLTGDDDTIVYLFGPKKPNGKYARYAAAFNDDVDPGANLNSHVVFSVPTAGMYRIVVSTYDNWLEYPVHVSRGDYRLIVKCQGGVFGACGPAVSDLGGACWEDTDCLSGEDKPLHCEGEVTCLPGTQCLFVRQGTCVEDYTWMTYAAKQCSNPWSQTVVSPEEASQFASAEYAQLVKHYAGFGIVLDEVGALTPSEPSVHCLACGCARGDLLTIKVKTPLAAVLANEHGWIYSSVAPPSMGLSPRQCGTNPWQTAPAADEGAELELVDTWLAGLAAKVNLRGFASPVQQVPACSACSCARGDRLIAFPVDQESAGRLSAEGFSDLQVP